MSAVAIGCNPIINHPAPSLLTSVTLSRMETAITPQPSSQAQNWDTNTALNFSRFKIAPRLRSVANVEGEVSAVAAAQAQVAEAVSRLTAQWKTSLLDRDSGRRSRDLSKTVEPVMQALLAFGPSAIDLRDLPLERVNGLHLAVVLRVTFTQKEQTPGWTQALAVARAALRRENVSEASALSGLL